MVNGGIFGPSLGWPSFVKKYFKERSNFSTIISPFFNSKKISKILKIVHPKSVARKMDKFKWIVNDSSVKKTNYVRAHMDND